MSSLWHEDGESGRDREAWCRAIESRKESAFLSLAGEGGTDGCGSDLRDGNGEAIGLEVKELDMEEFLDKDMVEPLDKEAEEVELSSLPSLFLLRRELSLSTAATSYTDIF